LYEHHDIVHMHNDVTRLLFLKACIHSKNYEKGHVIIVTQVTPAHMIETVHIKCINTAIHFYGEFDQIERAIHLYH